MIMARGSWRSVVALGTVLTFSTFARPVSAQAQNAAQDEIARHHFETGSSYFERGEYDAAIEEFRQAYELSGRVALQFNISVASEKLARYQEAADALELFLEQSDEIENRASLEARLANLRKRAEEQAQAAQTPPPEPKRVAVAPVQDKPPQDSAERTPVYKNPWLWTAVGVVVVGAAVGGAMAAGGGDSIEDPYMGSLPSLGGP